ncbi:MAG: hypothetical protein KY455_10670 [Euryarchaeota archaeon]|nr:hypothetical protein [Euryarchaeota archaeon]
MRTTRIAGRPYDRQNATEVEHLAKVHTYVSRIRDLARAATGEPVVERRLTMPRPDRSPPWSPELRDMSFAHR